MSCPGRKTHTNSVKNSTDPGKQESTVESGQHLMAKGMRLLTFSLSQILSRLLYAMLSRSSLVISSTDFTSYRVLLEQPLFFFRSSPACALSTCPITTNRLQVKLKRDKQVVAIQSIKFNKNQGCHNAQYNIEPYRMPSTAQCAL